MNTFGPKIAIVPEFDPDDRYSEPSDLVNICRKLDHIYPFQLRLHDVVQLIPDDVELHHCIRAEYGPSESQPWIVRASLLPSMFPFGDDLSPLAGAPQLGPLCRIRIILVRRCSILAWCSIS